MKVLCTGAAGYVGCKLVPALLADDHEVTVYDMFFFDDHLPVDGQNLVKIKADIRDTETFRKACWNIDTVVHLACISNDPSFELDESLSRTMNYECFEPLVLAAKAAGVGRFIYCSTSSVYGISDSPDVREDHPLVPLTLYNTYKAKCEPLLLKHRSDDFVCMILRPSTICGYSPRQRLDLAVNILTNQATNLRRITIFGGEQKRPNLHIDDMVDCYRAVLGAPAEKVQGETFNVGARNMTIKEIAKLVKRRVENLEEGRVWIGIATQDSMDTRSYQVNSDKIRDVLGFVPRRTVEDAVDDLWRAFQAGKLPNSLTDDRYFNVQRMRKVWAELYAGAPPPADPVAGPHSEIDRLRMGR